MTFHCVTLFPDYLHALMNHGVLGQAVSSKLIQLNCVNPRQWTSDAHHTVDDRPYGGGDGMVMLAEPLQKAVESLRSQGAVGPCIYTSPQGQKWSDTLARQFAREQDIILVSGRYAGVDQRFIESYVDQEISIGDFVLTGGEVPSALIMESVSRFCPGVLGNSQSSENESFVDGLLECPQWTRPRDFKGMGVPEILFSGHHEKIQKFRRQISIIRTFHLRPDLQVSRHAYNEAKSNLIHFSDGELASFGVEPEWLAR